MGTQNERSVIDLVINGKQSEVSMKSLTAATINQRKALYSLSETDPGYKKQKADLEALMRAQQQRIVRINDEKTAWQKFKAGTGTIMAGVTGGNLVTAGASALLDLPAKLKDAYQSFNSASQDLSAVTGATGKDLEYLNKVAADTGPALGKSGAEMLEAYKMMASAKPELLEQKELLVATTEAALTLAQAGKIDLAEATKVTAESLNQFGESANQANRFINVIAAGAKEGSAEINEMGMALKASGTVAASENVSFEQTNALLQSMSTIALKGEQAGTMLRNVLLTLGSGSDDTNPKVVGLEKALDNLAKKNLSTAELTKLFGKENIVAAQHIMTHRDQIEELTRKMTGTDEAYSQAAKNNATLEHTTEMFWAKVEGLAVALGTRLAPAFTKAYQTGTDLLTALPQLGNWLQKNGEWLLITGIPALIAYNGAMITATASAAANTIAEGYRRAAYQAGFTWLVISEAATKAYALATGVLTGQITVQTAVVTVARKVWAVFNATLLLNPIGLVVAGLAALVAGIKYFSEHTQAALDLERKKQALQKQGVKDTQESTKALTDLNQKVSHYNELSKAEQEEVKRIIALKALEARARLAAAYARAREVARDEGNKPNFWQGVKQGATDFITGNWGNLVGDGLEKRKREQAEANKASAYAEAKELGGVDQLKADLDQYNRLLDQTNQKQTKVNTGGGGPVIDPKKVQKNIDDLEDMLADSRKRIASGEQGDYDNEVAAFAEKYSKMYEMAFKLTKDGQAKIDEIKRLSLIEMDQIENRRQEKEDEKARKQAEKDNKEGFDAAMKGVDQSRTDAYSSADRAQAAAPKAIGDAEVQMQKLQADQNYLTQKLLMEQTFAQESAETQRQLTENWDEQVKLRAQTEHDYAEQMKQAEYSLQDAKRSAMATGVDVLKGFLKEGTLAYKAAIVAQKAFAIAQVFVDMNREIAQIYANPAWSLMPDGGLTLKTSMATAAKVRAGVSIASIAASGIMEVAQKADGGFTGISELYGGNPAGFTNGPTFYNQGGRSYIAGEKGREWIMSAPMLRNPVMANLAGALQALQVSGQWRNLSLPTPGAGGRNSSSTGGESGMSLMLLQQIYQQLQLNNANMEKISRRPQVYNRVKIREADEYEDEITAETSL